MAHECSLTDILPYAKQSLHDSKAFAQITDSACMGKILSWISLVDNCYMPNFLRAFDLSVSYFPPKVMRKACWLTIILQLSKPRCIVKTVAAVGRLSTVLASSAQFLSSKHFKTRLV